jgi:succinyl-CoA synthetase beta subunit
MQGLDGDGRAINEFDAKRLLAAHGLPVARELLVATVAQALAAAAEIGYPVVLKAVADAIPHKTELGLVVLGINDDATLGGAWEQLGRRVDAAGVRQALRGFLVQEFVPEGVEVFAGIVRDPDFGLFLAFGAGGTDIETMRDFALRSLPLREGDAEAMIAATDAVALLAAHRGKPAADLTCLADCLYSLANYAEAGGARIAEIDLNPIKVLPEGQGCIIVDALIVTATTARGPAQ